MEIVFVKNVDKRNAIESMPTFGYDGSCWTETERKLEAG
jgi:hypothetical protein